MRSTKPKRPGIGAYQRIRNCFDAGRCLKKKAQIVIAMAGAAVMFGLVIRSVAVRGQEKASQNSRLAVVRSSADPEVAHRVCFMYIGNAKKQMVR